VLSVGRHAAPGDSRISEWHDPDRFLAGLELYRNERAPRLLFTGGQSPFQAGLVRTVRESGAKKVYVTHGQSEVLTRYLQESEGIDAEPLETLFEGESD